MEKSDSPEKVADYLGVIIGELMKWGGDVNGKNYS